MSSFSDAVLSHPSLRVYYRMGESSGTTLVDIGPNALNGTYAATGITYGVTSGIIGDPSTAVTFDGTSDGATRADNNALDLGDGPLSIEFWVKRSATQGVGQTLLNKDTGAYLVSFSTTNGLALGKAGTGNIARTGAITDQLWHHIVITKNGSATFVYQDGVDVTVPIASQTLVDNATQLWIAHAGPGVQRFPGSMDDLALYGAVLSPTEVLEHYNLGVKNYFYTTQTFTADGNFTPGAGVERVTIECRGGGGGGGTSTVNCGGGGGGGALAKTRNVTVVPATSYAIVVGQGGTGAGGDSSFATTTVVAKGGGVGGNGSAGGAGTAGAAGTAAASTGSVKKGGGAGGAGNGLTNGGGGGGSAGDNTDGGAGATSGVAGTAGSVGGGAGGAGGTAVSAGGTGTIPGAGGGGASVALGRGSGARGVVNVSWVEVGVNTSIITPTQSEAIADTQTVTSTIVPTAAEALAEIQDLSSVAALSAAEALAEIQDLISIASYTAAEVLAEISDLTTVAVLSQSEALADPPGDLASSALLAAAEALADTNTLTSTAFLTGLEALADVGSTITIAVFTANWQRISPGLSGTVYDSTGATPVVGAQVLVFRDDTNALIATLTSDALGAWALDLDPAFTYWISGWKTGSPQVEDRTDRAIPPVETVVEVGT